MSRQFAETRLTLTAEIIFALALGSGLNMLHRNVDRLVDGTFFRQRHLAEERLAKAAAAVLRAESHEAVDRFSSMNRCVRSVSPLLRCSTEMKTEGTSSASST